MISAGVPPRRRFVAEELKQLLDRPGGQRSNRRYVGSLVAAIGGCGWSSVADTQRASNPSSPKPNNLETGCDHAPISRAMYPNRGLRCTLLPTTDLDLIRTNSTRCRTRHERQPAASHVETRL
jgi:hypothetical protein